MKLFCLLTIISLSVASQAAEAKKVQRKPNSVNMNIPVACQAEDEQVADPEKTGDDCAKIADQIHTSAKEQFKNGKIKPSEAQEAFEYEGKIRQVSNSYYITAMKKIATEIGVRK